MCMGGGGRATITQPDYNAYDKQFQLQKDAITQSMNSGAQLLQQQLNTAVTDKQNALTAELDQRKILAENTSAQAQRMAALIGTPPPEKTASAPVTAANRGLQTKQGKQALRIERGSPQAMSQGTGLNIA